MSVPLNKLSSVQVPDDLIEPYDREVTDLTDWQRGGIALSDASETLDYQNWSIDLVGNDVTVTPETVGSPSVIFTRPDIEELSLAFDNNMRPVVAFVQAGQAILYFFDPVINDYQFQNLPAGAVTPRCVLDDTRPTQVQTSSVVVSYVYDNSLWLLDQRDRYTIPYNLTMVADGTKLDRMGMGENFRLHWVFQTGQGGDFVLTLTGLQNGEARIGNHASIGYTISPDNGTETVKWSDSFDPVLPAAYGTGPNPTDFAAGDGGILYLHVTDSGIVATRSAPIRYAAGQVTESILADWTIDDDVLDIDLSADFSVPNLTGGYVISGLPTGVVDDGDGSISGTPTGTPESISITATFTDQYGRNVVGSYSVDTVYRAQATTGISLSLGFPEDSPIPATDLLQNWNRNGNTLSFVSVAPALPDGLSIDADGVLTGTPPTPAANETYTITVQDEYGRETSDTFSLEVSSTAFSITLTGLTDNEARIGDQSSISYTISPDNGTETVKWSNSSDPADPATYGTGANPTDFAAGDGGQLYLHVTDSGRTVSKSAPIRYAPGSVTESALADWVIDDDVLNVDLSADFSTPNLTGTYVITGLPTGVVDDGDGTISGTPISAPQSLGITATFTDQYGRQIVGSYSGRTVYRGPATGGPNLVLSFPQDSAITPTDLVQNWSANGNTLTFVGVAPNLPAGLSIDSSGTMTGTPTDSTASVTYTLTMEDEYGRQTSDTFSLEVTEVSTAPTLAFAAAGSGQLFTEGGSSEFVGQYSGSGSPGYVMDAGTLLLGHDGIYVEGALNGIPAYGARWDGGIPYSDDGAGSPLAEQPALLSQSQALTNLIRHSNNMTVSPWGGLISAATRTETGLTGQANTAMFIEDASGFAVEEVKQGVSLASTNNSIRHTARLFVNKDSDTGRFPNFWLKFGTGNTALAGAEMTFATYTPDQGLVTGNGTIRKAVFDRGNYLEVLLEANNTNAQPQAIVSVVPAANTSYTTTNLIQAVGSLVVQNVEFYEDTTIEDVAGTSPIITENASVTQGAIQTAYDDSNHDNAEGLYYFEFAAANDSANLDGNLELLSLNAGADLAYYNATSEGVESTDGTNVATASQALTADTYYRVSIAFGSGKLRVRVNGTWGAEQSYDGGFASGSALDVLRAWGSAGRIRNLRRYDADYDAAIIEAETLDP